MLNLAPLSCRRDIANLGIIFRAITRRGPKQLRLLFKLSCSHTRSSPRFPSHRYQVLDEIRNLNRDYLDRSTYGYIAIFNMLPECMFHCDEQVLAISVSDFQSNLNKLLKIVSHELDEWYGVFSPRTTIHDHVLRRFTNLSTVEPQ